MHRKIIIYTCDKCTKVEISEHFSKQILPEVKKELTYVLDDRWPTVES